MRSIREKKLYKVPSLDSVYIKRLLAIDNVDKPVHEYFSLKDYLLFLFLTYGLTFIFLISAYDVYKFYQSAAEVFHWLGLFLGGLLLGFPSVISNKDRIVEMERRFTSKLNNFIDFLKFRIVQYIDLSQDSPRNLKRNHLLSGNFMIFLFSYLWTRLQFWFNGFQDDINYVTLPWKFINPIFEIDPLSFEVVFVGYAYFALLLHAPSLEREVAMHNSKRGYKHIHYFSSIFNIVVLTSIMAIFTWTSFRLEEDGVVLSSYQASLVFVLLLLYVQPVAVLLLHTRHTLNIINGKQKKGILIAEYCLFIPFVLFVVIPLVLVPTIIFLAVILSIIGLIKVIDQSFGVPLKTRLVGLLIWIITMILICPWETLILCLT